MTVETLEDYGLRVIDDAAIDDFLRHQGVGVLGLPDEGGPYLLPMAFGYDGDDHLYFTFFVGGASRKEMLSERADEATFLVYSVDSMFSWESVVMRGRIEEIPEADWPDHETALSNAWRLDVFERAESAGDITVFAFEIQERTGYKYAELPPGFESSA